MASDTRSVKFSSNDQALLWRAFQAVEDTALRVATAKGYDTKIEIAVIHGSGEYRRSNVAEAKVVADRHGFNNLVDVTLTIERGDPATERYIAWVSGWLTFYEAFSANVEGDDEVDVNGVFAMLEPAINQAKIDPNPAPPAPPEPATPPAPAERKEVVPAVPASRWKRLLNHPYSVQVLGGAGAVALVAIVVALWAVFR